jgi:hypothetical protein
MLPEKIVRDVYRKIKHMTNITGRSSFADKNNMSYRFDYECQPDECFKRPDGLWQLNHLDHNGHIPVFLWRLGSKYCCTGHPIYTSENYDKMYKASETRKLIQEIDGLSFYWTWENWNPPTETLWGATMTPPFVQVYRGGRILFNSSRFEKEAKAELIQFLNEYQDYPGNSHMIARSIVETRDDRAHTRKLQLIGELVKSDDHLVYGRLIKLREEDYASRIQELANKFRKEILIPFCNKNKMKFYSNMGTFFFERNGKNLDRPQEERKRSMPNFRYNSAAWATYCNIYKVLEISLDYGNNNFGHWINGYRDE